MKYWIRRHILYIFFVSLILAQQSACGNTNHIIPQQATSPLLSAVSPALQKADEGEIKISTEKESLLQSSGIQQSNDHYTTGSCVDRCHVDFMKYQTMYHEEFFRHRVHSPRQGMECHLCHENYVDNTKPHGNLVIQNKDCVTCHHKDASDEDCLKCHAEVKEYMAVQYKKITPFEHKTHTGKLAENFKLRCTTCHTNLGGERHFEMDINTCNTCHFMSSEIPVFTRDKKLISDCTLCHTHIEKAREICGKTFRHDMYEGNKKVSCSDCHFETVQGNGKADKESCYPCPVKVGDDLNNTSDIHSIHILKHKTACTSCHASISHGWIKDNNNIIHGDDDNLRNGDSDHDIQNLVIAGMGGIGIKGEPDPMYLATLNCSACHKNSLFTNVKFQTCNNCHGKGFDKILFEQKRFVSFNLQVLKTLLIKAKRYQDVNTDRIVREAEVNYNLIKEDGSFGVHNIKYVKDLLGHSIGQLQRITRQNAVVYSLKEKREILD